MRRICRIICFPLAAALVIVFCFAQLISTLLPDTLYAECGGSVQLAQFPYVTECVPARQDAQVSQMQSGSSRNVQLGLFGVIPVKNIRVVQTPRRSVNVCGIPFGIKMFTDGALIVGFSDINTSFGSKNPAKTAGLRTGDVVQSINGTPTKTNEDVAAVLQQLAGAPAEVQYVRNKESYNTLLTAAYDTTAGVWRAGMWVRDSSAGIGTLSFYSADTGIFAGLGHSVHDTDTGDSLIFRAGEIVRVSITGVQAGGVGTPGELKGRFSNGAALGRILANDEAGVYGKLFSYPESRPMPVAFPHEVTQGDAQILVTVDAGEAQLYDIKIEKISLNTASSDHHMVIHVTDGRLISQTGGIVQGMSGSPIIQNGRFVGSVTHVFVNDPTRGYAIFAQNMLQSADAALAFSQQKSAA